MADAHSWPSCRRIFLFFRIMANMVGVGVSLGAAALAAILLAWENLTETDEIVPVNNQNLTFQLGTYTSFADTLQSAIGDPTAILHFPNMASINATFNQLQTKDDLAALINAFGIRDRDLFGVGPTLFSGTLTQWLLRCLEESELQPIRAKFAQFNIPF